jgi:hypothetical protein
MSFESYSKGAKLYLAEFKDKETNETFLKFGFTKYKDAADRFLYEPEQYNKWDIRILCTAYNPDRSKIEKAEEYFKKKYPKNFWLEEKISGVTEIVKMTESERLYAIQEVRALNNNWKTSYLSGYKGK